MPPHSYIKKQSVDRNLLAWLCFWKLKKRIWFLTHSSMYLMFVDVGFFDKANNLEFSNLSLLLSLNVLSSQEDLYVSKRPAKIF